MKKLDNSSSNAGENHSEIITFTDLASYPLDVHVLKPNTAVVDPLTGQQIQLLYGYRTVWEYQCTQCTQISLQVTMFRTRKHLIIACNHCHQFIWFKIFSN